LIRLRSPTPHERYVLLRRARLINRAKETFELDNNKTVQSYSEGLDGNGQLYLVLQDINLKYAANGRRQILVIISDEEWDLNGLKTPSGDAANETAVPIFSKRYTLKLL
jgi:hypothetical protein